MIVQQFINWRKDFERRYLEIDEELDACIEDIGRYWLTITGNDHVTFNSEYRCIFNNEQNVFEYSFQPATMVGALLTERGDPSRITIVVGEEIIEVNPVWLNNWKMVYFNSFVDMIENELQKLGK